MSFRLQSKRFELVFELGTGGMGTVFQVRDSEYDCMVALKTLHSLDGDGILRFKREFRSLQEIEHPNIISLGELIEDSGQWFFTMEIVDGPDFVRFCRPSKAVGTPVEDFALDPTLTGSNANGDSGYSEPNIRNSLNQLVKGLMALHASGFIHRDLKPSNILVDQSGRVVILDLGLVSFIREQSSENVVGTALYMAPEQAASKRLTDAADWYSVGCILFECLTGEPPINGRAMEVLMKKQHTAPVRPSSLNPHVPKDLDDICVKLLSIEPEDRLNGKQILRRLGEHQSTLSAIGSLHRSSKTFVGRSAELKIMTDAFADVMASKSSGYVFVEGESGIGKTALVEEFLKKVSLNNTNTVTFESKCYERESVSFKAFDGVIDALSNYLMQIKPEEAAVLLPYHLSALVQVFPVLKRSQIVAKAIVNVPSVKDPTERRKRAFEAIREIFLRLGQTKKIVIVVDDFQWADADSMNILNALFAGPDEPPIFFVATVRRDGKNKIGENQFLASMDFAPKIQTIQVLGLSQNDTDEFVKGLLQKTSSNKINQIRSAVNDSNGHPLFIQELVNFGLSNTGGPVDRSITLEQVILSRVAGLSKESKNILELVSTSNGPCRKDVINHAVDMSFTAFSRSLSELRVAKLIKSTGARSNDTISVFHDQIKRATNQSVSISAKSKQNERLAFAMEALNIDDPYTIARYWQGAGETQRSYKYLKAAADEAAMSLAFERAATLYRTCLDHDALVNDDIVELRKKIGLALVSSGKNVEAANVFMVAAKLSSEESVDLNSKAAACLLQAGHIESAFTVIEQTLGILKIKMPASANAAIASLLKSRMIIRLRGLKCKYKERSAIPEIDLAKIDVLWAITAGLSMIDIIRATECQAKHIRFALASGDPYRIARALFAETIYRAFPGKNGVDSANKVLAQGTEVVSALDNPPNLIALKAMTEGYCEFFLGNWSTVEEKCLYAEKYILENCSEMFWELSSARLFALWGQWYQGKMNKLSIRVRELLKDAENRGDRYTMTSLNTFFQPMIYLRENKPDYALTSIEKTLDDWQQKEFNMQHYFALLSEVQILLYEKRYDEALVRMNNAWRDVLKIRVMDVEQNKIEALHCYARVRLAHASTQKNPDLSKIIKLAKRIPEKSWGLGFRLLLLAGVENLKNDKEQSSELLSLSEIKLRKYNMAMYLNAAMNTRGQLLMNTEGEMLIEKSQRYFSDTKIVDSERFTHMLVPGFDTK